MSQLQLKRFLSSLLQAEREKRQWGGEGGPGRSPGSVLPGDKGHQGDAKGSSELMEKLLHGVFWSTWLPSPPAPERMEVVHPCAHAHTPP